MNNKQIDDFINSGNWFDKKYAALSDYRYPTFKAALNFFIQREGRIIVETGTSKHTDDWGAGKSTIMLADFANKYEIFFYSIDIISGKEREETEKHIRAITSGAIFLENDAVKELASFDQNIDLLFLDSLDFPDHQIAMKYGSTYNEGWAAAKALPHKKVLEENYELLLPCQKHCYNELMAAMPYMNDNSVVLIDDNLPGFGKKRLAAEWLRINNWTCVLDMYQSLWIKNN